MAGPIGPNVQLVTLQDVRAHLRYPPANTLDDNAILGFIAAAADVIQAECGDILPRMWEEYRAGGDISIYTWHKPILSVQNVEEGWGWINWELDYVQVNTLPGNFSMFAYSVDSAETGKITRRTAGNIAIPFMRGHSNVKITYTTGRDQIPGAIRLAALELIAHWWQNSQMRAGAATGQYGFDAVSQEFPRSGANIFTSINYGVPYRILEMLKPFRREPIIG